MAWMKRRVTETRNTSQTKSPTKPKRASTLREELWGWRTGMPSSFLKSIRGSPKPSPTMSVTLLDRVRRHTCSYHEARSVSCAIRVRASFRDKTVRACFSRNEKSTGPLRSEEHTSELQSLAYLVC